VSPADGRGGAEDYALTVASAARGRGWEVEAALPEVEATQSLREDFRARGVPTRRLVRAEPYMGRREVLLGSLSFAVHLLRWRPRVVHITLPWPIWAYPQVLACALTSVPAVVAFQLVPTAGEIDIESRIPRYGWARSRRQRWIAVSDFGRRQIVQDFRIENPDEVEVIRNGVELAPRAQRAFDEPPEETRATLGLEPEVPVAISVGRLSSGKGHDVLIGAVQKLADSHPQLHVLIVGEGEERARLQAMVDSAGLGARVRLLGRRGDVQSLLHAANVFVLPSRTEGTPFALLEAMANRVPVIASRFGGADEVVSHRQTGLLTPVDDPAALAAAMATALNDPTGMRTMADRAQAQLHRFSRDTMVDRTLEVLARVAR